MVVNWLKFLLEPAERCGPLCRDVQDEVASIGRAEALARQARKHRNRQRGTRAT